MLHLCLLSLPLVNSTESLKMWDFLIKAPLLHTVSSLTVIAVFFLGADSHTQNVASWRKEQAFSTPALSNHPFFWHAGCVFQLQVDSIYKTGWEFLSQMPTCLWRIWIREQDGRMLKGISVLYEARIIFPLISTTSNRKVLEPNMLYTVMALLCRGRQTLQSSWQ